MDLMILILTITGIDVIINLLSDIHLEINKKKFEPPSGDILLLAGDIGKYTNLRTDDTIKSLDEVDFFLKCSRNFDLVYYIAGNHEFYNGNIIEGYELLNKTFYINQHVVEPTSTNICFLDNQMTELNDDWNLFGGTMWTNFGDKPLNEISAEREISDFYVIVPSKARLTNIMKYLYKDFLFKLDVALKLAPHKNFVVMSHFAPSLRSVHERFKNDVLINPYFCNSLDLWIMDRPQIKVWCHGHVHNSFDYMIGDCRVIANPRGYGNENNEFDRNFTFEI